MLRFLASSTLLILGNAIGLIVAAFILPGFSLDGSGFIISLLFFSLANIILSPFILKLSLKYVSALQGGVALVTTFVVLVLTSIFTAGVEVSGLVTWIIAPLVIWISVVLAGVLLPLVLFKKVLQKGRSGSDARS